VLRLPSVGELGGLAEMSYYVARLKRPYDYRVLIEAYIYTQRTDFVHPDFKAYYASLLKALEDQFGIHLSHEGLTFPQKVFWMLFQSTVRSLLQITNPWANYLDATLLHRQLEASGELGRSVEQASDAIYKSNEVSEAAHREMLDVLFQAIFGECQKVVTSEELLAAGFDDSKEPDIVNYYDDI
jgi:hypothetical protein